MFYDPMISKLITWGKDRKEAMDLMDKSIEHYVVQGVTHNLGFGRSIIRNKAFAAGDYSTAFIPTYYPDGYHGDTLNNHQMQLIALAAHRMKNINSGYYKEDRNHTHNKVVYVTILGEGEEKDKDWKVEMGHSDFTVTDIADGKTYSFNINKFDYIHNSLLKMDLGSRGVETI
jgi:propionyl-CoA carboxylase alpha chain